MRKKYSVSLSQERFYLLWVGIFCSVIGTTGCSTAKRSPAPSQQRAADTSDDKPYISSESMPPPATTKLSAAQGQDQAGYHFSMGQAASLEGDSNRAIEEYKIALSYDPNSAVVHTRLGGEYVKRGLLTLAIEQCKIAVGLDAHYIDARLLLAGLYSSTKLIPEAIAEYDKILKLEPKNPEAYVFKGSLLLDEDRVPEAITVLKKLIAIEPEYYLGYYYLGRAYQHQDKTELAISSYGKALETRPGFSQAGLSLGLLLEEKKRTNEALKAYEDLYEHAGDLQAVARIAQIYIDKDQYDKALKYLVVLAASDEDNLNVQVKIGLIYIEQKNYDKAADAFRSILHRNADAEKVRYYLASVYEEQKKYDEAIEEFKKITPSSGVYMDSMLHVAHLLKLKGDTQGALAWINDAIQKNSNISQFYLFKASLQEEDKKVDDAVATLENARSQFPRDEKILYYLGSLYDKQSKMELALKLMSEILVFNPDNVQALNYIGYTYASKGTHLGEAESFIRKAVKLKPDDGYIQDSLGYLLLVKGQVRQAMIELEKAFRLKPDEGVILEHLGDAYLRGNLKLKALQKYQQASKLYSDPSEKEKLEKKIGELRKALGSTSSVNDARQPAAE